MLEDLINGKLTVMCHSKADFDTLDSIIRTYAGDQVNIPDEVDEEEAEDNPYYYVNSDGEANYSNYSDRADNLPHPIIQFSEFTIGSSEKINTVDVRLEDVL